MKHPVKYINQSLEDHYLSLVTPLCLTIFPICTFHVLTQAITTGLTYLAVTPGDVLTLMIIKSYISNYILVNQN